MFLQGAFIVSNKLYGLNFREVLNVETYSKEVNTYEVTDDKNNFIALLYTDFHPREGKRAGSLDDFVQINLNIKHKNTNDRPHISIVCNFTKPTKNKPSLY